MPFRSEAQRRYLFAKEPKIAKEFAKMTPKGTKLPEYVAKQLKKRNEHKAVLQGLAKGE